MFNAQQQQAWQQQMMEEQREFQRTSHEQYVKTLTAIVGQLGSGTDVAKQHQRSNYILNGIAIVTSVLAALLSAGIIEIPWLNQ